jgi:tetratricopeptide (TPR) repeat protein
LGYYYANEKRFELAEQAYEKALYWDTNVIAFLDKESTKVNLSSVKLALGKDDEAKRLIESTETVKKDQEAVFAYNQAAASWEKGDLHNIIVLLSPFVDYWKIQEPNFLLARAYIDTGQKDKAIDVLNRTVNILDEDKRVEVINLIEELKKN